MAEPNFDNIPPKLRERLKFGPPTRQKSDNLEKLTGNMDYNFDLPLLLMLRL
jgi:hypothetical protein